VERPKPRDERCGALAGAGGTAGQRLPGDREAKRQLIYSGAVGAASGWQQECADERRPSTGPKDGVHLSDRQDEPREQRESSVGGVELGRRHVAVQDTHSELAHNFRPGHDAHVYEVNGVKWIRADGNGISAFTTFDSTRRNWWRIPKGLPLPGKIRIVKDLRPGFDSHFMLAPAIDMLLAGYIMYVDKLRSSCVKVT
jgi:hypothetical protein